MIESLKDRISVSFLCEYLGVTRGWYYKWLKLKNRSEVLGFTPKSKFLKEIKKSFDSSNKT